MQQYLPFTVLKLDASRSNEQLFIVATVPTVYGIETYITGPSNSLKPSFVATVPTVYGIETVLLGLSISSIRSLQQYLPFTVLKPAVIGMIIDSAKTGLTVVATVPTVYGIETNLGSANTAHSIPVATVPTVYGIETFNHLSNNSSFTAKLQQYLPFTVLKLRTIR